MLCYLMYGSYRRICFWQVHQVGQGSAWHTLEVPPHAQGTTSSRVPLYGNIPGAWHELPRSPPPKKVTRVQGVQTSDIMHWGMLPE